MYKEPLILIITLGLLIYIIPHIILTPGIFFKNKKSIDQNKIELISAINTLISQYNIFLSEADSISREVYHELSMIYPPNQLINKKIEKCHDTFCNAVENFNKHLNIIEENMDKMKYDELYDIKHSLQEEMYSMDDEIKKMKIILQDILSIKMIEKNLKDEKIKEKQKENVGNYIFFKGCNNTDMLEKRFRMLAKIYHPDNQCGNSEIFLSIQNEYLKIKEKMEEQSYEENSI